MTIPDLPAESGLSYRNGALFVDDIAVARLAQEYGTPLFVYSQAAMLRALQAYRSSFTGRDVLVCYAVKANTALGILQTFARNGCGFDIVSGGDLQRVLAAGGDAGKVNFSGVGKTRDEMRQALRAGIACFNVESLGELDMLSTVAVEEGRVAPVSLRINPDVDPKTHPYISTGLKGSKFGIDHTRALAAYRHAAALPGLRVCGIDMHIGSQITSTGPYLEASARLFDLVQQLEVEGIVLEHIDFGGGLGIDYGDGHAPPGMGDFWAAILALADARGLGQRRFVVEPGRSLVGNAGICLTQVLGTKSGVQKNYCIVDAAMNDLPRPALYQSWHRIVPVQRNVDAAAAVYDVVGPVCESGDWLGRDRTLAVQPGDVLAVLSAGAYCMSMASNYNTRPRAAEVLVHDGDRATLIRRRETFADMTACEQLLG